MPDTIKAEQQPVQSQLTHRKCKGHKTGDTYAADIKQISIWLANEAKINNHERSNRNNGLFKVNSQCIEVKQTKRHRWCVLMTLTDHYVVETYATTSKY